LENGSPEAPNSYRNGKLVGFVRGKGKNQADLNLPIYKVLAEGVIIRGLWVICPI
jgi:hypothetical protein